jgi:hypothetical protein
MSLGLRAPRELPEKGLYELAILSDGFVLPGFPTLQSSGVDSK